MVEQIKTDQVIAKKHPYSPKPAIEEVFVGIKGEWQDTIIYKDGSKKVTTGTIKPNQIQNTFSTLLASLCKAESGYGALTYMAIGSGQVSWDSSTPSQPYATTELETEYFRKAIDPADMIYIDPVTNISTGGTPSSKIEIAVTLESADAIGTMREFGLFGGTATTTLDSGELVNWVVHNKVDKDTSVELQRIVRIEFVTR